MAKSTKFYTGIGSRETPDEICVLMSRLGCVMAENGFVLRSGGAKGADESFELGCKASNVVPLPMEIYLPWDGFNSKMKDNVNYIHVPDDEPSYIEAMEIMSGVLPHWSNLKPQHIPLHTRNVFQVLGRELDKPSSMVFYYSEPRNNHQVAGGTNGAVQVAHMNRIPTFNLYYPAVRDVIETLFLK